MTLAGVDSNFIFKFTVFSFRNQLNRIKRDSCQMLPAGTKPQNTLGTEPDDSIPAPHVNQLPVLSQNPRSSNFMDASFSFL